MPFKNLGGDPRRPISGEGITEDIIGALAHNRSLLVIAHIDPCRTGIGASTSGRSPPSSACASCSTAACAGDRPAADFGRPARRRPDRTLWAEKYDGAISELFEFQTGSPKASWRRSSLTCMRPKRRACAASRPTAWMRTLRPAGVPAPLHGGVGGVHAAGAYLDRSVALDQAMRRPGRTRPGGPSLLLGEWRAKAAKTDVFARSTRRRRDAPRTERCIRARGRGARRRPFSPAIRRARRRCSSGPLQLNKNSAFAWGLSAITSWLPRRADDALGTAAQRLAPSALRSAQVLLRGRRGFAEFLAGATRSRSPGCRSRAARIRASCLPPQTSRPAMRSWQVEEARAAPRT